jgi:LysR family hydrogen peroxide-inducible transcriptional activator
VVPTAAGERIVERARDVLTARDRLATQATQLQDRVSGTVRIGMLPTLSPYLLPLVLPELDAQYPELTLVLREWPTAELLQALRDDVLDTALIATDEAGPDFHEDVLFTEPFVGYVAADHSLTERDHLDPSALSLDDLWILSEGHCFRDQVLELCGRSPRVRLPAAQFQSGSLETLIRLVRHSGGMTLLPALATQHMPEAERAAHVVPFADPLPTRDVRLVARRRHKQRLVDAFTDVVYRALPDLIFRP